MVRWDQLHVDDAIQEFVESGKPPIIFANSIGAGLRAAKASRRWKLPLFLMMHSSVISPAEVGKTRMLALVCHELRLLAVSTFTQGLVYGSGAAGNRTVRLLPNIVPEQMLRLGDQRVYEGGRQRGNSDEIEVLYIGSPYRAKGFDVLLDVMQRVAPTNHRVRFRCAGVSGEEPVWDQDPTLGQRVKEIRRCMSVEFLGRVSDITEPLRTADIAFLPSPLESFGRPVLEAAAARVPIVCSGNPGHISLVQHRVSALVFPPARAERAAELLVEALTHLGRLGPMVDHARRMAEAYAPDELGPVFGTYLDEDTLPDEVAVRWRTGYVQRGVPS